MDLNKVSLVGSVIKISSYKGQNKSKTNTADIKFCMTTKYIWKDTNEERVVSVEYHDIVAYGRIADVINTYVKEGSKLYVEGRLAHVLSIKNNRKHYADIIIAEDIVMLGKGKGNQ